ncbi:metallophosphoesterase [Fundicoccus culcitae]|uniref:Metallophosphoesterase n=1 Tax=Fundicoccus culcitae TaxID=2969821 RepID=A0ABY5P6U3_9LACT|nr:metallophosphoesterase [Fundicoccus culcitae]UUX34457.1 metallophosphoesterase [Fundicoccus culcitae]
MKKFLVSLVSILAITGLATVALNKKLKHVTYQFQDQNIKTPVHIAVLTDLHNNLYGPEQVELIEEIKATNPDLILLVGDIFEVNNGTDNAKYLLEWVGANYPAYFVTGNHEYYTKEILPLKELVESYHIKVLDGDVAVLKVGETYLQIGGMDDGKHSTNYPNQMRQLNENFDSSMESYNILLSHRPEIFEDFNDLPLDLILSGHTHGGQWRIPGLINGLFAPDQGLFPKYAGGEYDLGNRNLVISRGLIYQSKIPRIFNRPELVTIELVNVENE